MIDGKVLAACIVFAASGTMSCVAQRRAPGGYSTAPATDKDVMDAAAFAVVEQQARQNHQGEPPADIALIAVVAAERQVVAGVNYRLRLKTKVDGKEREAETVVWWQAWRKDEPHRLTSWNWL